MHVRRLAAVSWCAVALAAPQPAQALVPHQVVSVASTYVVSEITIYEGDTLTLTNLDPNLVHDLVSLNFSGSNRLFRSDNVDPGKQGQVHGVESLAANAYPFLCSLHFEMRGNLYVEPRPVG